MLDRQLARKVLPAPLVTLLDRIAHVVRRVRIRGVQRLFALLGLNVAQRRNYASPLPVFAEIERHRARWDRPSALPGLNVDADTMSKRLVTLAERWEDEFTERASDYAANAKAGFGPGYPAFDARTLYYMLREHKPNRYLEVGSGLSTYYATLAAERNAADGHPMQITCIEPYPYARLHEIPNIELINSVAQDVPVERFGELEAGDVLFIDSSHALKLDSDVAYLLLEVLPRVTPGVLVHIHDMPFPYNFAYPSSTWIFGERWPAYWNEAMAVQLFLAFNAEYQIELSTPLIRHADESLLVSRFADYVPVASDPNPPSSLWLRRVSG